MTIGIGLVLLVTVVVIVLLLTLVLRPRRRRLVNKGRRRRGGYRRRRMDAIKRAAAADIAMIRGDERLPVAALALFRLNPAEQVLLTDRLEKSGMVAGHVPADHPDNLVIAVGPGHVPALAPDELHLACLRTSPLALFPA